MNKRIHSFLILVCLLCSFYSHGQSYHFSQFYSTPLLLNPAFSGYTDGPWRTTANLRSQWIQGGSPYMTSTFSFDASPFRNKIPEGHRAGAGLIFVNDRSLGGAFQTNSLALSMAYNLVLNAEAGSHTLGLGLQGSYQQRRIDFTKLTFENQFSGNGFDPSIPIGEPIGNIPGQYMDASAGLQYTYAAENLSLFAGASAFNLLQQRENNTPDAFRIPVRYAFSGGFRYYSGERGTIYFSANYLRQGKTDATTIGAAYGWDIGTELNQEIKLGMWHRLRDAVIPYLGYHVNGVQVGLSYDVTVSAMKTSGMVRNAFELTFIYQARDRTEEKKFIPWY